MTKFVMLLLALTVQFAAAEDLSLKQHMTSMGFIMDEIWVKAANPADYPACADKVSALRGHLVQTIGLTPSRIAPLHPNDKTLAMIDYHQTMARVIYQLAALEMVLRKPETLVDSQDRVREVHRLLSDVSATVGTAHGKFR